MSAIDMSGRLQRYCDIAMDQLGNGHAVRTYFARVALIKSDTASLPSFDAETKKKDKRFQWFVENYGNQAWELDAMNPNDLRDRIESEILEYVDFDAWNQHQRVEAAQQESVRTIADKMAEMVG